MTQAEIDKQIRNSWVRGSRVEIYSRGRKKWMRGLITRIFVDDEGEWIEVRYGKNLVKETPRESPDMRPLRVRYKNRFTFTVELVASTPLCDATGQKKKKTFAIL